MLNYDPKDARKTLPDGKYEAELIKCEEKTSKAGKPMVELTWRIYPNDHPSVQLRDWVAIPSGVWKLEKMAKAWGKEAAFKDATFNPEQHLNETLIVKLKTRADDKYGEQNTIAGYEAREKSESSFIAPALREQMKRAEADMAEPVFAPDALHSDVPF